MNWRLGTCSWTDPDWVDAFYPRDLEQGRWLAFYARHFDTVEIDSTFYAIPPAGRLRRWAEMVPDDFRFTVKAPRLVTHELPLDQAIEQMRTFVEVVRELGEKLGAVLIQFPPCFGPANQKDLLPLLDVLPQDLTFAVEFRHPGWWNETTRDILRERRLIWVAGDYDEQPLPMLVTADQLYVRWIGTHGRFAFHGQEQQDRTERLRWWLARFERVADQVHTVWGMFSNDFTGSAIETCNRFKGLLGLEVKASLGQQQGRLF